MIADTAVMIGTIASVVAAVVAVVALWAIFGWFRPRFDAKVDERRQAIKLEIDNKGFVSGQVNEVAVINGRNVDLEPKFFGLDDERFWAAELPRRSSWRLIMRARRGNPFPEDARVRIRWGNNKERAVVPEHMNGKSYYGPQVTSQWPEGH